MPINYKDYPPDWEAISLRIRNERAGGCCEQCGAPNGALIQRSKANGYVYAIALEGEQEDGLWKKPVRVVLTVAHIDRDKTHNDDSNLAAWCQRCHLRHDLQQHIENRRNGRNWKRHQHKMDL